MAKVKFQTVPVEPKKRSKGRRTSSNAVTVPIQSDGLDVNNKTALHSTGAAIATPNLVSSRSRSAKLTQRQLENHLWGAAKILRGKTAGQDYKTYILSLIFYKRLCDQWENEADEAIAEQERQQARSFTEAETKIFKARGKQRFQIL